MTRFRVKIHIVTVVVPGVGIKRLLFLIFPISFLAKRVVFRLIPLFIRLVMTMKLVMTGTLTEFGARGRRAVSRGGERRKTVRPFTFQFKFGVIFLNNPFSVLMVNGRRTWFRFGWSFMVLTFR